MKSINAYETIENSSDHKYLQQVHNSRECCFLMEINDAYDTVENSSDHCYPQQFRNHPD